MRLQAEQTVPRGTATSNVAGMPMTDDEAHSYLRRFDEREVIVRFVEQGTEEELHEIWTANFIGADWEDDAPANKLLAAVHVDETPPSHTLSVRRGYVHWGASGATESFILTVAAGALGTSVGQLLRVIVAGMVKEIRTGTRGQPFSREQAGAYARQKVVEAFGLAPNLELSVVSEEHRLDDGEWTIVLEGDGARYEVDISDGFASALLCRIKRCQRD